MNGTNGKSMKAVEALAYARLQGLKISQGVDVSGNRTTEIAHPNFPVGSFTVSKGEGGKATWKIGGLEGQDYEGNMIFKAARLAMGAEPLPLAEAQELGRLAAIGEPSDESKKATAEAERKAKAALKARERRAAKKAAEAEAEAKIKEIGEALKEGDIPLEEAVAEKGRISQELNDRLAGTLPDKCDTSRFFAAKNYLPGGRGNYTLLARSASGEEKTYELKAVLFGEAWRHAALEAEREMGSCTYIELVPTERKRKAE